MASMKLNFPTAISAGVLSMTFALQAAQAQTPPTKMVNRDQLRVCMNSESDLAARRQAIDVRNKANNEEAAAIRAEQQELANERQRIGEDAGKVDRFMNRRVKPHNDRVKIAQEKEGAFRTDLDALNKALAAHNDQCGGTSFMAEDKEAILKEREAAKKP